MSARAQYPCVNGISTNPSNPINNQLPSKRNTFFNWQVSPYKVQPINTDCIRNPAIESPFVKIDNLEALRESKDMHWTDGWELIRRGFGLNELNQNTPDPVPNLYMILYNRYTGILRVVLRVCRGADYSAAKISIRFDATTTMKTDLLEFSRNVLPLTKAFTPVQYSAGSPYWNDNTKWFHADFPMMYDPCTCAYRSKLQIISNLITTSDIRLEGTVAGDIYTKDVAGKAEIQQSGSFTELSAAMKLGSFLKAGVSSIGALSAAVSLLDVFIGGGKQVATSTTEVKLLPLSVNLTANLRGAITTTSPYHNIIFTNPGSKDAALSPDIYPYYNEVMGIFNLLQTPEGWHERTVQGLNEIYTWAGSSQRVTVDRFAVDTTTIKYVLNPAAGLTIQEMKIAVVTEGEPGVPNYYITYSGPRMAEFPFEGKDNQFKFRSKYVDATCLPTTVFTTLSAYDAYEPNTYYGLWNRWRPKGTAYPGDTTAYLKIMLNLKRKNATGTTQNILYVLTYPMIIRASGMMKYWQNNSSCSGGPMSPASPTVVNNFCGSTAYTSTRFNAGRKANETPETTGNTGRGGMTVYPNTNNGQFTLRIASSAAALSLLTIVDVTGRTLYSQEQGNLPLDNGYSRELRLNLPNGTCQLVAVTEGKILTTRFVVVK